MFRAKSCVIKIVYNRQHDEIKRKAPGNQADGIKMR